MIIIISTPLRIAATYAIAFAAGAVLPLALKRSRAQHRRRSEEVGTGS